MKKLFVAASAALVIFLLPSISCMDQDKNSGHKIKAIIEDLDKPQRVLMSTEDPNFLYQDLTRAIQNPDKAIVVALLASRKVDPNEVCPKREIQRRSITREMSCDELSKFYPSNK